MAESTGSDVDAPVVHGLVPYAHVADVAASVSFYSLLGFEAVATVAGAGEDLQWAHLQAGRARLMLAAADAPVDPGAQAVLFYLYTDDLASLRRRLTDAGVPASPITHPAHMPAGEMRLVDPDGYVVLVGQHDILA